MIELPSGLDDMGSAVGLGMLAAQFATEPGRYPEFVAWCNTRTTAVDASWLLAVPPDAMAELAEHLRALFILFTQIRYARLTITTENHPV
jgi:hypothetical protein